MDQNFRITRILAGIKNPLKCDGFIQNVCHFAEVVGAEHVTFLYVTENLEELNFPITQDNSAYEGLLLVFKERTETIAKEITQAKITCEIREGNKDDKLVHWVKLNRADLLILSRREGKLGSASRSIKVTRLAACHVLIVPEKWEWKPIKRALIPIDFSEYSELAIKATENIAGLESVYCLNVYEVPAGYYYIGCTEAEAEMKMLKNARNAFEKFIGAIPAPKIPVTPAFLINKASGDIEEVIGAYAKNNPMQLFIIGSKGLTGATGFMLGSVAQALIRNESDVPVLVVKNTNEKISLLDALMS